MLGRFAPVFFNVKDVREDSPQGNSSDCKVIHCRCAHLCTQTWHTGMHALFPTWLCLSWGSGVDCYWFCHPSIHSSFSAQNLTSCWGGPSISVVLTCILSLFFHHLLRENDPGWATWHVLSPLDIMAQAWPIRLNSGIFFWTSNRHIFFW